MPLDNDQRLEEALRNADKAGDTAAATTLAQELRRRRGPNVGKEFAKGNASSLIPDTPPQPKPAQDRPMTGTEEVVGGAEAALTAGSGMAGASVANIVAAVREIAARATGDDLQTGRAKGQEAGNKVADLMTIQPHTQAGKTTTTKVGELLDESKVGGMNPAESVRAMMPKTVGAQLGQQAEREMRPPPRIPSEMPGVGSAETDVARLRRERAAGLPQPVSLTKGQATRDFEQQRFEREAAKSPKLGQPLRERFAEQNEQILRNFDTWVEQTGAEAPTLRATGQVVDEALVSKAKAAKKRINEAYDKARASGEMQSPVSTSAITDYLTENASAEGTAKMLSAVRAELARLEKVAGNKPGHISVNDMERLRQFIGENATPNTPDMVHAPKLKAAIDAATENAGGALYKQARRLRSNYAKEFEDRAVVAKLLDTKGKSADRAVALEDVFSHSILDGSLDDVKHLRGVLQTEGPKGQQAWKELQGQTITYIREQAAKGATADIRGNPIVSAASLNKVVKELDSSGKLDFVFGKQGAQQVRDIADLAKDVFTSPPGAVNTSVTASVLLDALDGVASVSGHGTTLKALTWVRDKLKGREVKKRVRDSLGDPTEREKTVRQLQEAE